jgi:hypothetical protein
VDKSNISDPDFPTWAQTLVAVQIMTLSFNNLSAYFPTMSDNLQDMLLFVQIAGLFTDSDDFQKLSPQAQTLLNNDVTVFSRAIMGSDNPQFMSALSTLYSDLKSNPPPSQQVA